ncbi:MAG: helix-turn-helix transcriptional regulator [Bacteroidota bacterium]
MPIHIGNILKTIIKEKHVTPSGLALKLGVHIVTVSRMFHYRHMHASLLIKISQILGHDFFKYYSQDLRLEKTEEDKQITEIKKQIEQLQKENEYLSTINNLLMSEKKKNST